jgi:hypothetical protein
MREDWRQVGRDLWEALGLHSKNGYFASYIYNGPHTIVSTMPQGYSITFRNVTARNVEESKPFPNVDDSDRNIAKCEDNERA